ncbi:MAG: hypothetical protein AAGG00_15625 [Cyanobacteria bacterium P01_H01_bin.150]
MNNKQSKSKQPANIKQNKAGRKLSKLNIDDLSHVNGGQLFEEPLIDIGYSQWW